MPSDSGACHATLTCHRCWGTGLEPTNTTTLAIKCRDCGGWGWMAK